MTHSIRIPQTLHSSHSETKSSSFYNLEVLHRSNYSCHSFPSYTYNTRFLHIVQGSYTINTRFLRNCTCLTTFLQHQWSTYSTDSIQGQAFSIVVRMNVFPLWRRPGIEATTLLIQSTLHTLGTYIKGWAETNKFSTKNAALISFSETESSSFYNHEVLQRSNYCCHSFPLDVLCSRWDIYYIYSLESPPLPQVFSLEGWRTRGGATMLVQVCLVQRRCTLGEWPECTLLKQEVEPIFSVFRMTQSTTHSTHAQQIPPQFMAQNTNGRLLVVMITMYHVLFAMQQQEQLKWWFLPRPAALQTGQESIMAI